MVKVLLSGGSGFLATHILRILLEHGFDVVTTVRSKQKGQRLLEAYPSHPKEKLSYIVIEDIAQDGAFDLAFQTNPSLEFVIHTASPFRFDVQDAMTDILDPAIKGTVGILKSIKAYAPAVKRVVVTSSFAAMVNPYQHAKVYDESSWNPIKWDDALANTWDAYRSSKTFAEKAAWDFMKDENPGFDLSVMNPSMSFGPVTQQQMKDHGALNTSNSRILDFIQGKAKENLPKSDTFLWVDVRDAALGHIKAIEVPEAGGHRFFLTEGYYSNKRIVDAIRETHPELAYKLPPRDVPDDLPEGVYGYDNTRAREVLGLEFRSLTESMADTVTSLLAMGY